jgi:hypothetical protein
MLEDSWRGRKAGGYDNRLGWLQRRLDRRKRSHVHFTPASASWLNMIERFFRDPICNRVRRGVFRSVPELVTAIEFSREYSRFFGQPPMRDIKALRDGKVVAIDAAWR